VGVVVQLIPLHPSLSFDVRIPLLVSSPALTERQNASQLPPRSVAANIWVARLLSCGKDHREVLLALPQVQVLCELLNETHRRLDFHDRSLFYVACHLHDDGQVNLLIWIAVVYHQLEELFSSFQLFFLPP